MTEQPTNRILGTVGTRDGRGFVRMEDHVDTDVEDLWTALTEPARLARWLGEVDGDLRPGGEFRATFFASGWEGVGRVVECEPPHRLLVVTTEAGESEEHAIEATLTGQGEVTVLVVEERGMPPELLPAYGAGVQVHVEDLASYLAGGERCDAQERWTQLAPAYEALPVDLTAP